MKFQALNIEQSIPPQVWSTQSTRALAEKAKRSYERKNKGAAYGFEIRRSPSKPPQNRAAPALAGQGGKVGQI